MIVAQTWLNNKYPDKNTTIGIFGKSSSSGGTTALLPTESLSGELKIEDFPNLKELELSDSRELDKLVIKNCPRLEKIDVRDSGVKEIEFGSRLDNLLSLDFSFDTDPVDRPMIRRVDELDISNASNLKVIRCFGEQETKFRGIEKATQLQFFSSGTSLTDATVALLPTKIFREWKEGVKKVLGITTDDLPDTWKVDLATKLGGKNLSHFPTGQTLATLIASHDLDKNDLQDKLEQAQAELDKQKDYSNIKTERDQLKQQLEAIRTELGLAKDSTQDNIINKIQELNGRPTTSCSHTDYDTIKNERDSLKTDNENKKRKISQLENANKENMKNINVKRNKLVEDWGLTLSTEQQQQIKNASASEVEKVSSEIFKTEFSKLKNENSSSVKLSIGLGVLTIGSLLILTWVMMKQSNLPEMEPSKKEKNRF